MSKTHDFITYVADRTASREVDALADYFGIGELIRAREITYKNAQEQLIAEFDRRDMKAGTAKTYLSQGKVLAAMFDSFDDMVDYADAECDGSRSMKRIYDSMKGKGASKPKKAQVDVVLAGLANLSDPGEIARVRDAAIAMLAATAAA